MGRGAGRRYVLFKTGFASTASMNNGQSTRLYRIVISPLFSNAVFLSCITKIKLSALPSGMTFTRCPSASNLHFSDGPPASRAFGKLFDGQEPCPRMPSRPAGEKPAQTARMQGGNPFETSCRRILLSGSCRCKTVPGAPVTKSLFL